MRRDGVHLNGVRYWDDVLSVWAGRVDRPMRVARPAREGEGMLVDALRPLQERIGTNLRDSPERRRRLEAALSTLWTPLDDPGAARPALALWIEWMALTD